MKLYYFTTAHYAIVALALRRLRVSRLENLNDPYELLSIGGGTAWHRGAFLQVRAQLNTSKGMLCFSTQWGNPVLWGHYADGHTGIALAFEVPDDLSVAIDYVDVPLQAAVDTASGRLDLTEELADRLIRSKFSDWHYEAERRIFVQLDRSDCESGSYYIDFNDNLMLREVILGPLCEFPSNRIRNMLNSLYPGVKHIRTQLAGDAFRVERLDER